MFYSNGPLLCPSMPPLLSYSCYQCSVISIIYNTSCYYSLSAEPNAFKSVFGIEIPPKNLSSDFNTLRALLNKYSLYNSSKLVGPDVTNPRALPSALLDETEKPETCLAEFLDAGTDVDAVTWHQ